MYISAAEALEFFTTELADDVLEGLRSLMTIITNEPWNHRIDFVGKRVVPVNGIVVTPFAVELVISVLMLDQILLIIVGVSAAKVATLERLLRDSHRSRRGHLVTS